MKSRDRKLTPPTIPGQRVLGDSSGRRRHLLVGLGLCLLTLAAYSNSFGAGFTMDNRGLILQDARVHAATPENFELIFFHTYWWPYGESGLFRPLTTLSYLFNYATLGNGENPAGYHWINFLLHTANVLLVYALGLRLTSRRPAAWTAALWAVHPVLTESVTNIVGRADLLAGMAVLGGLLLYLKSTENTGWRRWALLGALSATTAVGAFSKESAVTALAVIVLYEAIWWRERRQGLGLVQASIAMLIPIQAMLYQRASVLWSSAPTFFPFYDNPIVGAGFVAGRFTALEVMGKYLTLLSWPARLSCDYSWAQIPLAGGSGADWLAYLTLAGAAAAGVMLWRGSRTALFLAGAALLVFLPTSNLLFPIGTIMAERFLYLPAIAFAAGVVAAVGTLEKRVGDGRLGPALLGLIAVAYGARTWVRNMDWRDDLTLATAAVAVSPESYKSHLMVANSLFEADAGRANIDRVLAEAEKSLAILQPLPPERNNANALRLAARWYLVKADLRRPPWQGGASSPEATQSCLRALELLQRCRTMVIALVEAARQRPGFDAQTDPLATAPADVDRLISATYLKLGDTERALDLSAGAMEADPGNADAYRQYAQALAAAGRGEQAITVLMEGVMLTLDAGLRQNVVEAYQSGVDRGGCALMPGRNGAMALNPACEAVHGQLCAATVAAIRLRLKTGRSDLAEQLKNSGVKDFGCPAPPLDAALEAR